MSILMIIAPFAIGFFFGLLAYFVIQKSKLNNAKNAANELLEQAKKNVEKLEREAYVKAKEKLYSERNQFQSQVRQKENDLSREEERLRKKEKEQRRFENHIREKESSINKLQREVDAGKQRIEAEEWKLKDIVEKELKQLEHVSGLQRDDAKQKLIDKLIAQAKSEAAQLIIDIKNEAQENARWEAIEIMAHAMEKMATEYTMESTLISVSLPNDNWKGLIIGREGRNIKAFEAATGVKVIVDDTPETVVMSSFDPIKREVARITMERLIKNKNINPKGIDAEVDKAQKIVDDSIRQAANETLKELNIKNVHQELKECLGKLRSERETWQRN